MRTSAMPVLVVACLFPWGGCFLAPVEINEGSLSCLGDGDCASMGGICLAGRCFAEGTTAPFISGPAVVELAEDRPARFSLAVSGIAPALVRIDVLTPPERGSLVSLGGAELLYTPAPDDHGSFVAEVVATDGGLLRTPPAVVQLVVAPVGDPAIIIADDIVTDEDTEVAISGEIVDRDERECALTVVDEGALGVIAQDGDRLVYRPRPDHNGIDRVVLAAECGGVVDSGSQTSVDVTVVAIDDAPVAGPLSADASRLAEDSILPVALPFVEVDGDPVCFTITSHPARGTLDTSALAAGLVVYIPDEDANGEDAFTFAVGDVPSDGACPTESQQTVALQIDPRDDPPRFAGTIIEVDAVGPSQRVPVALSFPDGDAHGARLVVPATISELFDAVSVEDDGRHLALSPRANLTLRSGLLTVEVVDDRGLRTAERMEVRVKGVASCGHARLADPTHPSGFTLLERRRRGCATEPCSETFVALCEQGRRGGGFELLVKVPGSGSQLRRNAPAWTNGLLNEDNPVPDGGAAVLRGARDLPLDDLLILRPAEGFSPAAALDVAFAVDPASENLPLQEQFRRQSSSSALVASWDRVESQSVLPLLADNVVSPVCNADEDAFIQRELGLNHPQARIGGERIVGCRNRITGAVRGRSAEVMGLGLTNASARAGRLVFGRSRDFRSIVGPDCEALAQRFGPAFIPGLYTTDAGVVVCGDVDADRGCNDGAIGPGIEACDDGDDLVGNGCSPDCALVFCGDGIVSEPHETCEPNPQSFEICDDACGTGDPGGPDPAPTGP